MPKILITGASGFIGRFLCAELSARGFDVRGTMLAHESPSSLVGVSESVIIEPLGIDTPWKHALADVDTVIHLAARVHVMRDSSRDPLTEYRRVNVEGTLHLARQAVDAGVRRFVFISSIKINGEGSVAPYSEIADAQPADPYAVSKWEAEQGLRLVEVESGMAVVIVRPPLVYGPGVKANFLSLMKIIHNRIPLPFTSIVNKRSLIYVGNLVHALAICATHPAAAGRNFLVSDGEDISSPELIRRMAAALGVPARLFPMPAVLLKLAGRLTGKVAAVDRLVGSLVVDSGAIRRDLGWVPPFSMERGLKDTADWYRDSCLGRK